MNIVAVTGATGFVGRAVVDALLARGTAVVALLRAAAPDLPAAIEQRITGPLEDATPDALRAVLSGAGRLVHLAGIAHIGPGVPEDRYDAVNHRAVSRLADAAFGAGVGRLVFMSSIRALTGPSAPKVIGDQSPALPDDAYGRAKLAAERALAAKPIDHAILRPTLILGRGARGNLALLDRLARSGLPLPLASIGAARSMVGLDDVVAATLRALDDPAMSRKAFNLAHPHALNLAEMITALRRGHGRPPRLLPFPPALLKAAFVALRRADIWARIAAPLVVDAAAIQSIGFVFNQDPAAILANLHAEPLP